MAKPKRVMKRLLNLLAKKPTGKGDIRRKLKINRKTEFENIREAEENRWIEQDELKRYHPTMLGKAQISRATRPVENISLNTYSQVIDLVGIRSNRPVATCTIQTESAKKIKELDELTISSRPFLTNDGLGLPDNDTQIKAAAAALVDSILDFKAKDMGLFTILDQKLRDELTIFSSDDHFPTYDYMKRYQQLAKTDLKILIEFNGEEWVKNQNFDDLEKSVEDRSKSHREFSSKARLMARDIQIRKAVSQLALGSNLTSNSLQASRLFGSQEELNRFGLNVFKLFYQGHDEQEIIKKAWKVGLFEVKEIPLIHLRVNRDKESQFYKSLGLAGYTDPGRISTTATRSKEKNTSEPEEFGNIDNIISIVSAELEDFERAFVDLLQKVIKRFLYEYGLSSPITPQVKFKELIKTFLELFYLFDQMLETSIRRCIILWPKKVVDRNSLEKLNSVVFDRIINIRMLVHQALSSFLGSDFDIFFDHHEMGILETSEEILKHTEVFERLDLTKEKERLIQSILKLQK